MIQRIYLHALWSSEIDDVYNFLHDRTENINHIQWIRQSTGRICMDLARNHGIQGHHDIYPLFGFGPNTAIKYTESASDARVLEALSISQFHAIVSKELATEEQWYTLDKTLDVRPGAIVSPGSDIRLTMEVAYPLEVAINYDNWECHWHCISVVKMENGWTRIDSHQSYGNSVSLYLSADVSTEEAWLSQANHVFKQLQITSNFHGSVRLAFRT
ncbi:hypothetical protein FB45DRAFT_175508 [Roridomyces roridus]|uniref:Uncharacterized protein n=1 Tax=Roridomyces roridus TaxID=1738132 RepID=A0AAD7AWX4_9AGAR|nr:hypothetical protein FB45DRAFT_232668 [Roridomyces roridus]KAJ7602832.1 hypothetical protein FB45DRAFT_175508 [Roridomyces roridus]